MNLKDTFLIILIFLSSFIAQQDRTLKKAEKIIKKHFEIESFERETIKVIQTLNEDTRANFDDDNFFKIKNNDAFLGYAYLGNASSMTATFDYLVLLDENLIITKSNVLIYREEYGGEISSKRWLKQFIGKKEGDEVGLEKDIVSISGATISVTSMTYAINDLLSSLRILKSNNIF